MTEKHEPTAEMREARKILDTALDLADYYVLNDRHSHLFNGEQLTRMAISAHIDVRKHPVRRRD